MPPARGARRAAAQPKPADLNVSGSTLDPAPSSSLPTAASGAVPATTPPVSVEESMCASDALLQQADAVNTARHAVHDAVRDADARLEAAIATWTAQMEGTHVGWHAHGCTHARLCACCVACSRVHGSHGLCC